MKKDRAEASPLLAAAQAFDAELERFAHLTETAQQGKLASQKALERAAETLKEIADCEEQMQAQARALMAALGAAREQQERQAELASQRAEEVRAHHRLRRSAAARFQALGAEAAELNTMGQRLSTKKRDAGAAANGADAARDPGLSAGLRELSQRMSDVAEHAQSLAAAAYEADFEDVARQADSLRQQLLAARNKVVLLHGSLSNQGCAGAARRGGDRRQRGRVRDSARGRRHRAPVTPACSRSPHPIIGPTPRRSRCQSASSPGHRRRPKSSAAWRWACSPKMSASRTRRSWPRWWRWARATSR